MYPEVPECVLGVVSPQEANIQHTTNTKSRKYDGSCGNSDTVVSHNTNMSESPVLLSSWTDGWVIELHFRSLPTQWAKLVFVCLFTCLFGGMSKAGEIRTLPKTSLPVAVCPQSGQMQCGISAEKYFCFPSKALY
jgi:hypothetical protein